MFATKPNDSRSSKRSLKVSPIIGTIMRLTVPCTGTSITPLRDGHAVSRLSDLIIYSVETAHLAAVVQQFGPSTKPGATVAGQTSVKAPERDAFEKYLPPDVDIVSVHSLHGPTVTTEGQPMVRLGVPLHFSLGPTARCSGSNATVLLSSPSCLQVLPKVTTSHLGRLPTVHNCSTYRLSCVARNPELTLHLGRHSASSIATEGSLSRRCVRELQVSLCDHELRGA